LYGVVDLGHVELGPLPQRGQRLFEGEAERGEPIVHPRRNGVLRPPGGQAVANPALEGLGEHLVRNSGYYRSMPRNSELIKAAVAQGRLTVPTMAIGSRPVGDARYQQLKPITDDLTGHLIPNCGHNIPLDRPAALLALVAPFFAKPLR
jgi:pimeloyl-ACP methyl ester carboxylesterase